MGVIFVAGVHGVGKTTCCVEVTKQIGVPHHTASGIIKAEKASAIAESSKNVRDVQGNQDHLVQGVRKIIEAGEKRFILDGHFTLLDTHGQIQIVATDVFALLNIDGVVVFYDDPERIKARLQERDKRDWDVSLLQMHQDAELAHSRLVATTLQLPIVKLEAFDSSGLVEFVASMRRDPWTHKI